MTEVNIRIFFSIFLYHLHVLEIKFNQRSYLLLGHVNETGKICRLKWGRLMLH